MDTDDKKEPKIGGSENEMSILDEINQETVSSGSYSNQINENVAEVPIGSSNPFKMFFSKENRWIAFGGLFILLVVFGSIYVVLHQSKKQKVRVNAATASVASAQKAQPVGQVTELLSDEIELANQEIRKTDQFGYEIAVEGEMKEPIGDSAKSTEPKPKCEDTDTACMRIEGLIKPDACAPKDAACLESLKRTAQKHGVPDLKQDDPNQMYLARLKDPAYIKRMQQDFNLLSKESSKPPVPFGKVIPKPVKEKESDLEANASTAPQIKSDRNPGMVQKEELIELYHNSGDRVFATSDIALNSKIQGPVSVTIFDDVFGESVAIGKTVRVDDYMRLEFAKIVLPDDRECTIDAIALDSKTTYAAVASRVDHHTLYRYGWWGVGTALSAIGTAAQFGANSTSYVSDGVVVETQETTAEREMRIAAGELGKEIGKVMAKRIDTPSTVYVDKDEQMGFFFMKRLTSDDCK